jgi:molecular chaperone HtpG
VTSRLTTSPACIVANEPDTELSLTQRLRGSGLPSQPVLEINPRHPLVRRLSRDTDDPRLADWARVLYGQAVLTLGARIDEPAAFVGTLNDLLVALIGGGDSPDDGSDGPADGGAGPAEGSAGPAEGSGSPAGGSGGPAEGSGSPAEGSGGPAGGSGGEAEG